jgi:hypothetical protein
MSSATSIEKTGRELTTGRALKDQAATDDAGFRASHFFVLASLIAATFAVILSRQASPAHLILISLTIGAAGLAAAGFYRMLAPLVSDDAAAPAQPLSERTRASFEREKTLVLRSLKELEFDRAMGKVSQKDSDEMAAKLRARAISLMKQLDEGSLGYRGIIEREVNARLAQPPAEPPQASPVPALTVPDVRRCACGVENDSDAVFCKRCGTKL